MYRVEEKIRGGRLRHNGRRRTGCGGGKPEKLRTKEIKLMSFPEDGERVRDFPACLRAAAMYNGMDVLPAGG